MAVNATHSPSSRIITEFGCIRPRTHRLIGIQILARTGINNEATAMRRAQCNSRDHE